MTLNKFVMLVPIAMVAATAAMAAAPPAKTAPPPIDLQNASCAQFQKALSYANPGEKPTKERQEFAIIAQDALIQALMWVNGYQTGRSGMKSMKAIDDAYITNTIVKLNTICKSGGGTMRLADAVAKL